MALVVLGTDYLDIPTGTTSNRPSSPVIGMLRVNVTTNSLEVYSGNSWIVWKAF